jgi:glycosyltransferase involved in cell wall biosynthesis
MRIGIDGRKVGDFGIGTYIRGLLSGLAALDGEERYVVFAPASARTLLPPGVELIEFDAPHYSLREVFSLGRAVDRAGVDLFHAPHYVVPATKVPVVVTIHDLIHLHVRHRNPLAPLYARTMLRRAIAKSRRVLTVSEAVRRELIAELRCPAERIAVTPNGIDARFRPDGPRPRRPPYFLYAGNDKPHKNVATLVEAFASVRRERSGVELVLAGASFERFANRDGIVRAGFVPDEELASLYRGALALVLPSDEEGFGLPAAEAMASGTAVITSNNAALVEVTGDAALHVEGRDAAALAKAMLRVAGDDALRAALGSLGIEGARRFGWQRCAEITRAAYLSAV